MRSFAPFLALLLLAGCNSAESESRQAAVPSSAVSASESASAEALPAASVAAHNATVVSSAAPQLVHQDEAPSVAVLYQKCAACHGTHAEKSALNQSAVIAGWDAQRIAKAIEGYIDGTYGGAMKVLMKNQVNNLNRAEVEALSVYIANLNPSNGAH